LLPDDWTDPWDFRKLLLQLPPNWEAWEEESCLERNGAHDWQLRCEMGECWIACQHCKAEPYPDHVDLLNFSMPVNVAVEVRRYNGPDGEDWDIEFDVSPRS